MRGILLPCEAPSKGRHPGNSIARIVTGFTTFCLVADYAASVMKQILDKNPAGRPVDPSLLRGCELFGEMPLEKLEQVVRDPRCRVVSFGRGDYVLRQGERGNTMYLILDGAVEIRIRAVDGREIGLDSLREGDLFGEQALRPGSDGLRNASVRALTEVCLLEIPRRVVLPLISAISDASGSHRNREDSREEELLDLVAQCPLFNALDSAELCALSSTLEILYCLPGQKVVRQGEPGNCLYIVLQGRMEAYLEPQPSHHILLAELLRGQYFGEEALLPLSDGRRLASVRAMGNALIARLPGDRFRALLREHPSLCEQVCRQTERLRQQAGRLLQRHHLA
ncbi:MAG: cyclic nucleotide-binding domain-containing protein [Gammaproteobacteria bacterium]|nr:MAG: cyclic nucleotide-binding domain-containing protein [Gammaproteobacteria bacterium]